MQKNLEKKTIFILPLEGQMTKRGNFMVFSLEIPYIIVKGTKYFLLFFQAFLENILRIRIFSQTIIANIATTDFRKNKNFCFQPSLQDTPA
jgi:hypothetical protein